MRKFRSWSASYTAGIAMVLGAISGLSSAQAATETWTGATATWNTAGNWTGTNLPPITGDALIFGAAGAGGATLNNDLTASGFNIAGITYNVGASAYTIGGNAFTLTGSIINNGTNAQIINNAMDFTAARTVTTAATGSTTLGGLLSGTGGSLVVTGTGTLTVSNANNTFTGGVLIGPNTGTNGTVVRATATQALGSGTITIDTAGNTVTSRLELTGGISLNNAISLGGRSTTTNASILNVSGNNTLSGTLTGVTGGADYDFQSDAGKLTMGTSGATAITTVTAGRVVSFLGAGDIEVAGNIAPTGAGTMSLSKSGTGTLTLSGVNTYTLGTSIIGGGTVSVSNIGNTGSTTSNLGTNSTINITGGGNSGRLLYTGSGETTDRVININGGTAGATNAILDQSGTGALKFTSNLTSAGVAHTLVLQGSTAGTGEFAGNIVNGAAATSLSKLGTGTWTVSGVNTYTGGTTIGAGTLLVNNLSGSATGTGAVTFTGSATLGGAGTISGLVTTAGTGSVFAPGNSAGTLTLSGGLNATAGATFGFELGTTSDLISLGSGVLTGSTAANGLVFNFSNSGGLAAGTAYTLFTFGSSSGLNYTDFLTNSLPSGFTLDSAFGTNGYQINGSNLQVQFAAVPEPSTYALLGMGLASLWVLRRRNVKNKI